MWIKKLACSFCGRPDSEVNKLVAGPRVFICDRCAYQTIRIMETAPPALPTPARVTRLRRIVCWLRPRQPLKQAAVSLCAMSVSALVTMKNGGQRDLYRIVRTMTTGNIRGR